MKRLFLFCIALFGLAALPASAQNTCGVGDQVFPVQVDGIYPDNIYHASSVGICFYNDSDQALSLRYTNIDGDYAYTDKLFIGDTSEKLVDPGHMVKITAVTNVREVTTTTNEICGRRWVWTWYPYYGYYQYIYCNETTQTQTISDPLTSKREATLVSGNAPLSY